MVPLISYIDYVLLNHTYRIQAMIPKCPTLIIVTRTALFGIRKKNITATKHFDFQTVLPVTR